MLTSDQYGALYKEVPSARWFKGVSSKILSASKDAWIFDPDSAPDKRRIKKRTKALLRNQHGFIWIIIWSGLISAIVSWLVMRWLVNDKELKSAILHGGNENG